MLFLWVPLPPWATQGLISEYRTTPLHVDDLDEFFWGDMNFLSNSFFLVSAYTYTSVLLN